MSDERTLEHATIVEIDGRGVLIRGPSGSGKTALATELLFRSRLCGIDAALVADDYAFLSRDDRSGALIAETPEPIAGRIELRGFGIVSLPPDRHVPRTTVALSVALTDDDAERVADPARCATYQDVALPELALPEGSSVSAAWAVLGWLGLAERML